MVNSILKAVKHRDLSNRETAGLAKKGYQPKYHGMLQVEDGTAAMLLWLLLLLFYFTPHRNVGQKPPIEKMALHYNAQEFREGRRRRKKAYHQKVHSAQSLVLPGTMSSFAKQQLFSLVLSSSMKTARTPSHKAVKHSKIA